MSEANGPDITAGMTDDEMTERFKASIRICKAKNKSDPSAKCKSDPPRRKIKVIPLSEI